MKLRIYLDTSVFSAFYDNRVTERQTETGEFWRRLDQFEVSASELTREELAQTQNSDLQQKFNKLLAQVTLFPVTLEMQALAQDYLARGVFTPPMFNDALHVAAAVLSRQDILLSWNFKHLVNRRRRARGNDVNVSHSLQMIEIVAPPEI